jgi:PAS domain S-box-containing protein
MQKQLESEISTSTVPGKSKEQMPDGKLEGDNSSHIALISGNDLLLKLDKIQAGKRPRKFDEIRWLIKLEKDGVLYFEGVNSAFADLRGLKTAEFAGKPLEIFFSKEEFGLLKDSIYKAGRKGSCSFESLVCLNNEKRTLLTQIVLLPKTNGSSHFSVLMSDISELKHSAEFYRIQSTLLSSYIEIAGVMLVVLDIQGRVEMINKKGSEILGWPKEKIVGKDWFRNFVPEKYSRRLRTRFNFLMSGNDSEGYFENSIKRQDGSERIVLWQSSLIKDSNGVVTGLVSSGEDVTEHQRIRQELLRHSQNADFMFRLSRSISDSTDIEDLMNKTSSLMASYPHVLAGRICISETEGLEKCRDIGFGRHTQSFARCFSEILNKIELNSSRKHELLSVKTKFSFYGIDRPAFVSAIPMYTRNEFQGILLIASDEDELGFTSFFEHIAVELGRGIKRKKIEIEHKIAEELFSTVFHTNPDAMTIATMDDGIFLEVNKAFEEMTGFSREEVIGRSVFEVKCWDNDSDRRKLINLLKKQKKASGFVTTLLRKDNSAFAGLFSASVINYRAKRCMLAVVKDVTNRKTASRKNNIHYAIIYLSLRC